MQTPEDHQASGILSINLPCPRCGYSLLGLPESGACPECGSPVSDSLRGDLLRFADPAYLARLARGARMVWWSVAIILLSLVGAVFVGLMFARTGGAWLFLLIPLSYLASVALSLAGWWLLSTPDPGQTETDRGRVSRRVLRAALVTSVACLLVNVAFHLASISVRGAVGAISARTFVDSIRALTVIVALLAWGVQFFASMFYVRALARRIPDATLARRARITVWAAASIIGLVVVFMLVLAVAAGNSATVLPACLVPLALLVLLLIYVGVIERLKSSLVAVRRDATADAYAATGGGPAGTTSNGPRR